MIEEFEVIHYPACNSRCDGDSHWLDNSGRADKRMSHEEARSVWEAKGGRKARIAHRRRREATQ